MGASQNKNEDFKRNLYQDRSLYLFEYKSTYMELLKKNTVKHLFRDKLN